MGRADSFPPTLRFITGSTMEAEEAADRGLVLAPFSLLDGGLGGGRSIVALSGLLCFKEARPQSPESRRRRLMHLSAERGSRPHSNKRPRLRPGDFGKISGRGKKWERR